MHHLDRNSSEYQDFNNKEKTTMKHKYNTNHEFKAASLCRGRLKSSMKHICKKTGHTSELIGCTWEQLVTHLNDNSRGLKVGQKGVHIDHIRPVASFKLANDPIEQRACCNFNNLQLMTAEENMKKGGNFSASDAEAYATSDAGKAIAILRVGWELEFNKI
jgi:hypothetical protein